MIVYEDRHHYDRHHFYTHHGTTELDTYKLVLRFADDWSYVQYLSDLDFKRHLEKYIFGIYVSFLKRSFIMQCVWLFDELMYISLKDVNNENNMYFTAW